MGYNAPRRHVAAAPVGGLEDLMKLRILAGLLIASAALATARLGRGSSLEAVRESGSQALGNAAAAIPVVLKGDVGNLRCEARVRWSLPGSFGRCLFNRVVTEVKIVNGQAEVSCGELEVTCRQ